MNHERKTPGATIEAKLLCDLLAYLTTRPWQDVNALIVALVRAKEATASNAATGSKTEPRP